MRHVLLITLAGFLALSACGGGGDAATDPPRLVIQPDDGREPVLDAIAGAMDNIRLTIYQITDLRAVPQTPPAPADGIAQALIDKARAGVNVRVIVDHNQYDGDGSMTAQVQQTVAALRSAGVVVKPSSTAFCVTHEKTFVIDGPTAANPGLRGTAVIMSFNLTPGYFGGTRDYGVITRDPAIVQEAARVFDSDFALHDPNPACGYAYTPGTTFPPPSAADTPPLAVADLLWSPVNSKAKLLELIASTKKSLVLTTEEISDDASICAIQAVAQSAARPSVRLLLSGDTGSNAAAVKTLLALNLQNLVIRVMPGQPPPVDDPAYATPLYMHGKQAIVDGAEAFVGSENLTNTSLIQNRELGTFFREPTLIARLDAAFAADFALTGHSLPARACTSGAQCVIVPCPPVP